MVDFGSGQGLSDFETGGIACYFEDFKRAKTPPRAERCRLWMVTNPLQAIELQTMPPDRQGLQILKCRHVSEGIPSLVYKNITFKSTDTIPSEIAGTASKKVA